MAVSARKILGPNSSAIGPIHTAPAPKTAISTVTAVPAAGNWRIHQARERPLRVFFVIRRKRNVPHAVFDAGEFAKRTLERESRSYQSHADRYAPPRHTAMASIPSRALPNY